MPTMRSLSILVAALIAVVIGVIGRLQPSLFMAIPLFPLSIILWVSTGNSAPPFLNPAPWFDDVTTWTKPGDVIVSVGGKSGTTFMLYMCHQIRMKGEQCEDTALDSR